ncbi:dienelactone hydrolase family protein [Synechococcus sp. Nb3U1]|uniref:dienelactone hydrolase family protein n=1 Tax=Synechococcus sp. Nb3U1 TaxID=1914529 RepID=UPI00228582C7|nr:dienelactone hydrolase family protein [Synechococcus sp. Nb3U1]
MISFSRPDGAAVPAYLADHDSETESLPSESPLGGVVVLQEWWGLNPQIRTVADRLAEAGYRALVPDLYRGKLAQQLMGSLNREDVVPGYCWGHPVPKDFCAEGGRDRVLPGGCSDLSCGQYLDGV